MIDDWKASQKRINEAKAEAAKASRISQTLSVVGAVSGSAGLLTMVFFPPLLPVSLVACLVGTGLLAASGVLRVASLTKVSVVTHSADAAFEKAKTNCR